MPETNYSVVIQRILDILQANENFASKISEFRFGQEGSDRAGNSLPLCYVTTAVNPEVDRQIFSPAPSTSQLPGEKRTYEYWVVIIAGGSADPQAAQKALYDLTHDALGVLERNVQLRDSEGADPLCATSQIYTQGRMESYQGTSIEAMTIRVRPIMFVTEDAVEVDNS